MQRNANPAQLLACLSRHKSTLRTLDFGTITMHEYWDLESQETEPGDICSHTVQELEYWSYVYEPVTADEELSIDTDPVQTPANRISRRQAFQKARRAARCKAVKRELLQPVSLRDYITLENISMTAVDLLGPMDPSSASWQPLRAVLPPSLKRLRLRYMHWMDDAPPQFVPPREWTPPAIEWYLAYMGHLVELLLDKSVHFPLLEKLYIERSDSWPDLLPEELMETADKVGVRVTLDRQCRVGLMSLTNCDGG